MQSYAKEKGKESHKLRNLNLFLLVLLLLLAATTTHNSLIDTNHQPTCKCISLCSFSTHTHTQIKVFYESLQLVEQQ